MQPNIKITGDTQEVRSDKRKPIEDRKEREEIEKREEREEQSCKNVPTVSTCWCYFFLAGANFWSKYTREEKNTPITSSIEQMVICTETVLLALVH